MDILNIFSKNTKKNILGLIVDKNGFLECLELRKVKNSLSPVFWEKESLSNFIEEKKINKKKIINFFRSVQKKSDCSKIKIHFINFKTTEEHLKFSILDCLKIAGFNKKIFEVKKINSKGIILSNNLTENESVLYLKENNLFFYKTKNGLIEKKEVFPASELSVLKITTLMNPEKENKITFAGDFGRLFVPAKNLFNILNIDVIRLNVWQNILSFTDTIPNILKTNSYSLVEILALTSENLRKWKYVSIPVKITKNKEKEKQKLLPKNEKKVLLKKNSSLFLKRWKNKKGEELKKELEEKILKYSDVDILNNLKNKKTDLLSVDEKIKLFADTDFVDEN